jgi:aspartate carbamoyltransferase catalytic subunit
MTASITSKKIIMKSKIRHFSQVNDFTKEDFNEVLRRAKKFDDPDGDFTKLARGKVLGLGFFQESTRTAASAQAAIIRLGGGWNGIASPAGSYINIGEESMDDTLNSLADSCDILQVRHKNFDLAAFSKKATVPLMNGMCGGDEHSIGALSLAYTLSKHFGGLENLNIGLYGMVKSSRPSKANIRLLSKYGVTFFVDPVIPQFDTPDYIRKEAEVSGGKFVGSKLDDFIGKVDLLSVIEGLSQAGEDPNLLKEYNSKFRIMGKSDFSKVGKSSKIFYCMPAMMTDGRTIVNIKEADADSRCVTHDLLKNLVVTNMALITYLLGIKV